MKKILILGAGNAQIDLIERCKEMGYETHGLSYTNTDAGIPLLDVFRQINIVDKEAVAHYMTEKDIDYIYSVGSDIAVPTFAAVAEQKKKRCFVKPKTAQTCCNKHLLRSLCDGEIYNLPYICCENVEQARMVDFFPAYIKPVDSQGQRGVFRVSSYQEILECFGISKSYSKLGKVIIEKEVDGSEVSVNAYVENGKVIFKIISDRISYDEFPGGIIKAHKLPSKYAGTDIEDKIASVADSIIEKVGIKDGPVYFQMKIAKDETPYLIEVSPRLDGCHLWQLIKEYCGVDLLEVTVKHLVEGKVSIQPETNCSLPVYLEFFCQPTGTNFRSEDFSALPSVYSKMYYKDGDVVKKLNGYMEKCGYRIFRSPYKIGVIGGSGLIGSAFIQQYGQLTELENISRKSNVIADYSVESLEHALKGCDSAVILAAKKVEKDEQQSLQLYLDNITVTENALIACKRLGIKNIVYTSSRCVYASDNAIPFTETDRIEPINYYGISKYAGELLCRHYAKKDNSNIKILRLSQVIARDSSGYMLNTFLDNAAANQPLYVYGKGIGRRDYVYVKDVVRAIWVALTNYFDSGVYNIGSGVATSAGELAQAVIKACNANSEVIMLTDKQEDCSVIKLDTTKAKQDWNFECRYSLNDAIRDLVSFSAG